MTRFKTLIIMVPIGALLVGSLDGQQTETQDDAIQTEIKSLETQNASSTDAHTLTSLMSDDYVMIGLDGSTSSRTQLVNAELEASRPKITLRIQHITYFQGSAVVVGSATMSSEAPGGHKLTVEVNYTNVWMKRNGKWQLVSSHVSPRHPVSAELCLDHKSDP